MTFTPKVWQDLPNTTTPINAAALVDLENRLAAMGEGLYVKSYFSNADNHLYWAVSVDGQRWRPLGKSDYTRPMRDPSVLRYNGKWFVAYTVADGSAPFNRFGIASGSTLRQMSLLAEIPTPTTPTIWQYSWAPEWFVDSDGSVWILVAGAIDANLGTATFDMYAFRASNTNLTAFDAPIKLTGLGASVIDATVTKIGSTYHCIVKQNNASNQANSRLEHYTASSLTGPYTGVHTGDALLGAVGSVEAPSVISLGGTKWRLYFDDFSKGGVQRYVESTDNMATWQNYAQSTIVDNPDPVRHATVLDAKSVIRVHAEAYELASATRISPKRYVARAQKTSGVQSIPYNSPAVVTWDSATLIDPYYNSGLFGTFPRVWDSTNNRFVAPFDGSYQVSAGLFWVAGAVTGNWAVCVSKNLPNGNNPFTAIAGPFVANTMTGDVSTQIYPTTSFDLLRGDTLCLAAFQAITNPNAQNLGAAFATGRTFFEISWVA
jgi:hypothetical protein